MTTLCWVSHLLLAAQANPRITGLEVACLVAASVPFCLALVFIRKPGVLWLSLAGLLMLALPALLPSQGGVWMYPRFIIGQAGYILITMLPRRWGLVAALSSPVVLRLLWAYGPVNIFPDGFTIAFGVIPMLQLLGSNLLAWWVWHRLLTRAARTDRHLEGLRTAEMQALADREREVGEPGGGAGEGDLGAEGHAGAVRAGAWVHRADHDPVPDPGPQRQVGVQHPHRSSPSHPQRHHWRKVTGGKP